jgi:hypothetical protein
MLVFAEVDQDKVIEFNLYTPSSTDSKEPLSFENEDNDEIDGDRPISIPSPGFTNTDKINPKLRRLMNSFIQTAIGKLVWLIKNLTNFTSI